MTDWQSMTERERIEWARKVLKKNQPTKKYKPHHRLRPLHPKPTEEEKRLYREKRLINLRENPICEVFLRSFSTLVHHKRGRGPFFLDETTWMATCHPC